MTQRQALIIINILSSLIAMGLLWWMFDWRAALAALFFGVWVRNSGGHVK